jgi:hypothetical protein
MWLAGDEHRIWPVATAREPGQYGDGVPSSAARTPRPRWCAYRRWAAGNNATEARRILHGHDLACWCPLDQPCHAHVPLQLANR